MSEVIRYGGYNLVTGRVTEMTTGEVSAWYWVAFGVDEDFEDDLPEAYGYPTWRDHWILEEFGIVEESYDYLPDYMKPIDGRWC